MTSAVLDTNVIGSGVIRQQGSPGRILKAALEERKFTLVTSPLLLQEVAEITPPSPSESRDAGATRCPGNHRGSRR